eukprot:1181049-Prorocentrum_minimum.AAC.3
MKLPPGGWSASEASLRARVVTWGWNCPRCQARVASARSYHLCASSGLPASLYRSPAEANRAAGWSISPEREPIAQREGASVSASLERSPQIGSQSRERTGHQSRATLTTVWRVTSDPCCKYKI